MCLCKTPNYLEQWSFKIPSLADTISTDAGRPIGTAGVFCSGRRAKLATGRTYVLYCTCTSGLQYQLRAGRPTGTSTCCTIGLVLFGNHIERTRRYA
jgi:hypothetical protein